jgi:glycerol 3-phosphatase-2
VSALIDAYDGVLFDLDGVIYLGPVAVPGAPPALAALREQHVPVGFVTNNAARTPGAVAEHLTELGIPAAKADVVTSGQAGAQVLRHDLPAGAKVLVVGGEGVREALAEAGLTGVDSADDAPVAVLQGYGNDLTWAQLNEAAIAIHHGARWVATNDDPTRPTDRGLVPGNGAAVAAVRVAVSVDPEVAGKPYRPLLDETVARLGAAHPLFVGDRLDTDIAGAVNAGLDGLLVLTGSHGAAELLAAGPGRRPTHLGYDVGALLRPALEVELDADRARCAGFTARVLDGTLVLDGDEPTTTDGRVAAMWAAAHLAWRAQDAGHPLDLSAVLPALSTPAP